MSTIGYATLDVIPSVKGLAGELQKQTAGDLSRAGKAGGSKYGAAAGASASTGFKSRLSSGLKGFNPLAGLAIGAGAFAVLKGAFTEAKEAGQVSRVTAKLIESTGSAANVTSSQVGDLAERMMNYAAVDDEMVQAGANIMLSFRNVKNAAGEGNDIFDRSIKAGLDLATVLGTDLSSSALQLGKALNDPIKGVSSLGRAGVQFTEDQKEQIKTLVESGDLLAAQQVVLKEIEGQVGGAAGASADGTDRLAVAMGNLKEALGGELMPAVEGFSNFMVSTGIPAISSAGGAAKDAAVAFDSLPTPVKAAAAAFIALRIASATGLSDGIASSAGSARGAIDSLRIRTMLAGDEFTRTRTITREFADTTARVSSGVGRATASLNALRAGASGAGSALKSGIGGAVGLLGGPWGIALIAGTALLAKFWGEQREAKARVEELTAALDQQTGAITANAEEVAFKNLQDSGAIDLAKKYGISLDVVRQAALGNTDALAQVNDELDRQQAAFAASAPAVKGSSDATSRFSADVTHLREALGVQNEELKTSRDSLTNHAAFTRGSADATSEASGELRTYASEIDKAAGKLQKLIDKEKERALTAIQNRRDQIALRETLRAAREEAAEGARTLKGNSKAADENMAALLDLADQWANSQPKVTNAKGAYEDMRRKFVEVATQMGATKAEAKALADELIKVPKKVGPEFQSKGYQKLMAEIAAIKAASADLGPTGIDFTPRGFGTPRGTGPLSQPTKPAPTQPVDTDLPPPNGRAGVTFTGPITVKANTTREFTREMDRKTRDRAMGGRG